MKAEAETAATWPRAEEGCQGLTATIGPQKGQGRPLPPGPSESVALPLTQRSASPEWWGRGKKCLLFQASQVGSFKAVTTGR